MAFVRLRYHLLAHTGSPAQVSRPLTSLADLGRARQTLYGHTLWLELEEERENRAHTQYKHQRWPEPYIGDGKSELSLLSCSGKLYIQLYLSSPNTAVLLQQ